MTTPTVTLIIKFNAEPEKWLTFGALKPGERFRFPISTQPERVCTKAGHQHYVSKEWDVFVHTSPGTTVIRADTPAPDPEPEKYWPDLEPGTVFEFTDSGELWQRVADGHVYMRRPRTIFRDSEGTPVRVIGRVSEVKVEQ